MRRGEPGAAWRVFAGGVAAAAGGWGWIRSPPARRRGLGDAGAGDQGPRPTRVPGTMGGGLRGSGLSVRGKMAHVARALEGKRCLGSGIRPRARGRATEALAEESLSEIDGTGRVGQPPHRKGKPCDFSRSLDSKGPQYRRTRSGIGLPLDGRAHLGRWPKNIAAGPGGLCALLFGGNHICIPSDDTHQQLRGYVRESAYACI